MIQDAKTINIGTRGSQLALCQVKKVKKELELCYPEHRFEIKIIKTKGDKILDVALSKIGDKGLFTKEIEHELLDGTIDMAVHSLKDLPTKLPEKLCLGGVLKRGEARDALVSANGKKLSELTVNDTIATSSIRRKAQLLNYNPGFRIVDIRGNVDTRLKKMQEGYCNAIIMAAAGLQRLNLDKHITEILEPEIMIPAVAQGAIAIEIRENDPAIQNIIDSITDYSTLVSVKAERLFLNTLEGGCQVPIGCFSEISNTGFIFTGYISNLQGDEMIKDSIKGNLEEAEKIALSLAEAFIKKGAKDILKRISER